MNRFIFVCLALFSFSMLFTACEKEEPVVPNEEELITSVYYTLTPSNGGNAITLSYVDLDGDGGNAAVVTGATLEANMTYSGSLELLNELESPAEDITEEIVEEAEDHQFFFQSSESSISFAYNDQDADGLPIGLSSTLTTTDAVSGTITITLKHEPEKTATGVSDGNISNAGGETDIAVTFPVDVQ